MIHLYSFNNDQKEHFSESFEVLLKTFFDTANLGSDMEFLHKYTTSGTITDTTNDKEYTAGSYEDLLHIGITDMAWENTLDGTTVNITYGFFYEDKASALSTQETGNPRSDITSYYPNKVTHIGDLDRNIVLVSVAEDGSGNVYDLGNFLGFNTSDKKINYSYSTSKAIILERLQEIVDKDMISNNLISANDDGEMLIGISSKY